MNTILLATKAVQNREFRGKVKKAGEVRLARKANAKIVPGSPEAKARTAKAREVLKAKWAERKAALAAAKLCPTER